MKKKSMVLTYLMVIPLILSMQVYIGPEADSIETILEVDQLIADAFTAITRAEEAGFEVEEYIYLIHDAITLRDLSNLLQLKEEYEEAIRLANQAKDICNQIIQEIEEKFTQAHQQMQLQNITLIVLIALAAFLVIKTITGRKTKKEITNNQIEETSE